MRRIMDQRMQLPEILDGRFPGLSCAPEACERSLLYWAPPCCWGQKVRSNQLLLARHSSMLGCEAIIREHETSPRSRSPVMRETWTFHSAGQLLFGRNASQQLGETAGRLKLTRVLIATDPVLVKTGLVDRVGAPLDEEHLAVEVFTGGEPEPSFHAAEECIRLAKSFGPDAVIGLGGGSNMDLAKITATVLAHGGGPRDYVGEDK